MELDWQKLLAFLLVAETIGVGVGYIHGPAGPPTIRRVAEDGNGGIDEHAEETGEVCFEVEIDL